MKKAVTLSICVLLSVVMLSSALITIPNFFNLAEGTSVNNAIIYDDVYVGEYDLYPHTGLSHIVFGQIQDKNAEYGIIITDAETNDSRYFVGKLIGETGKFGIAIYDMPESRTFYAQVYSKNPQTGYLSPKVAFVSGTTSPSECDHNYALNSDETLYVCSKCDANYPSGKTTMDAPSTFPGSGYESDYVEQFNTEAQDYLFIGSSISNGYHTASDPTRTSMANMMRLDYLTASYTVYRNGKIDVLENVYLQKIGSGNGISGTYRWDSDTIVLNENGTGSLNGVEFEYYLNGNRIALKSPVSTLFALSAIHRVGDTVYKYTADGNTISAFATSLDPNHQYRYVATGEAMNMWSVSPGYEGSLTKYERSYVCQLLDAIHDIGNKHIDKVFIQLSTNDIGQFTTSAANEHLPFGTVTAKNVTNSSAFDISTSFGSLEYIVAKCKEQWPGIEVVLYSCWMMDSDWNSYLASGLSWDQYVTNYSLQSNYDNVSEYAKMRLGLMQVVEKWDIGYIDAWADYEANKLLNENRGKYKSDTVHIHRAGYERVAFPAFRGYVDGIYQNWEVA